MYGVHNCMYGIHNCQHLQTHMRYMTIVNTIYIYERCTLHLSRISHMYGMYSLCMVRTIPNIRTLLREVYMSARRRLTNMDS